MSITRRTGRSFWIDVSDPDEGELVALGEELGIPAGWMKNCLTPHHLPILEGQGVPSFLVLRFYDRDCADGADSIAGLTRKIVIFVLADGIVSVHHSRPQFIDSIRNYWDEQTGASPRQSEPFSRDEILNDLIQAALETYVAPLNTFSDELDVIEDELLRTQDTRRVTPSLYRLKRKVSALKRLLRLTHDLFIRGSGRIAISPAAEALVKDRAQSLFITADELIDGLENLVNQSFTIDAQRTNDTMRILTALTVIFVPLNLITGIFGMNFDQMPFVKSASGFHWTVVVMLALSAFITIIVFRMLRAGPSANDSLLPSTARELETRAPAIPQSQFGHRPAGE